MNRSAMKPNSLKVEVHINDKILFGKVIYKDNDPISKVLSDLKKIKILPDDIREQQVFYTDKDKNKLKADDEFSPKFSAKSESNIVIVHVPENLIKIEETQAKVEEYVKRNRENKRLSKGFAEADTFFKNWKSISSRIHEENYNQAINLCEGDEYKDIVTDFSNQHRQLVLLNKIYEKVLLDVMDSKDIRPSLYINYGQLEDRSREKLQQMFKRYSDRLERIKEDQYFKQAENGVKQKQIKYLQAENKRIASELDKRDKEALQAEKQLNEKKKELEDLKSKFSQYQRQKQDKISELWSQIHNIKHEYYLLQSKFQESQVEHNRNRSQLQDTLQQKQKELFQLQARQGANQQHVFDYVKYFTDKDVILNEVVLSMALSDVLLRELNANIGIFKGFTLLYKSDRCSSISDRFHKIVDYKENIFIICKTKAGRVFGGFSSLPFDPKNAKNAPRLKQNQTSFLFNIHEDKLYFYPLKPGCDSVTYCNDFIIFGNEEICINRHQCTVQSLFLNYPEKYLHYDDPKKSRQYFLSEQKVSKAELIGYEVYQIML